MEPSAVVPPGPMLEALRVHARVRRSRTVFLVIAVLMAFLLDTYATYAVFTSRYTGGSDFWPRWVGARMLFLEGKDPYSAEVTQQIQRGLYQGRAAFPGEDQVAFAYPLFAIYFVAPLAFLSYPLAQAAWTVVLQFALLGGLFLCVKLVGWQAPAWLLATTCLWAVLFYNHGVALIVGQYAVIVFFLIALALWSIAWSRDEVAGACLALSTVKPQMVFLVIPLLLVWALVQNRRRTIFSFAITLGMLCIPPLMFVPAWPVEFLQSVFAYSAYTRLGSPIWILTELFFPFLGRPAHILLGIAMVVYLAWSCRTVRSWTGSHLLWAVSLALIVTNWVAFRTETTHGVVFILPIVWIFRHFSARNSLGNLIVLGLQFFGVIGFWALFALTLVRERQGSVSFEHPIMFVVLPTLVLGAFVILRSPLVTEYSHETGGLLR